MAPILPPDLIERPALLAELEHIWQRRCLSVVAPAGYGKTTLLAQWAAATVGGDVAWWSIADLGSPIEVVQSLVAALLERLPAAFAQSRPVLQGGGRESAGIWMARLGAELASLVPRRICCVLDDLHLLGPDALGLLADTLNQWPMNVHFVLLSRWQPALDLSRLAARGQLLTLHTADLRYTATEIAQVLTERGLAALPAAVEHIATITGGWPTGVRLISVLPAGRSAAPRLDQAHLAAFLGREVLDSVPAPARAATVSAAYLPRFTPSILAALCGPEAAVIWQRNLFLQPLDDGWYTYDPLWSEVLRGSDRQSATARHSWLRRAAQLLAEHGAVAAAIDLYVALEDWAVVRALLIAHGFALVLQPAQVRRWLQHLPEEAAPAATLLHLRGLAWREIDPLAAAELLGAAAQAYVGERRADMALQVVGEQCLIHFGQGDEAALVAAARGIFSVPTLLWHSQRTILLRFPLLLHLIKRGKYPQALRCAQQIAHSDLPTFWRWVGACVVGGLYGLLSRSEEGISWLREMLRDPEIQASDVLRMSVIDLLAACLMLRASPADLSEARLLAAEAGQLSARYGVRLTALQTRATAIGIALVEADMVNLRTLAEALISPEDGQLPDIMLYRLLAVRAMAWARVGDLSRARADAERSERGMRRDDVSHGADPRTWILLAQVWYCCGEDQRTLRTLDTLLPLCRTWGARMLLTKGSAVRAAVLLRMGDVPAARQLAAQVWPSLLAEHMHHMDATPPDLLAAMVHTGLLARVDPVAIAQILAERQPELLHDLLEQLLHHPDLALRRQTVPLMGRFGLRRGYATLRALAKDPALRELVPAALRDLGARPPYPLHIALFGPLTLDRQGIVVAPADWPREKARHLLALLLLNRDRWLSREQIQEALWPEGDPAAGDGALRVTLNALLNVLEPERAAAAPSGFVLSEAAGLRLNPSATISTDLDEWQATLGAAASHEKAGALPAALAAYAHLAALYQDVLLADIPYAEWVLDERERRLNEFVRAASRRLDLLLAYGDQGAVIELAEQLLRHDSTCEAAYQSLIDAYTALGEPAAARRVAARRDLALG